MENPSFLEEGKKNVPKGHFLAIANQARNWQPEAVGQEGGSVLVRAGLRTVTGLTKRGGSQVSVTKGCWGQGPQLLALGKVTALSARLDPTGLALLHPAKILQILRLKGPPDGLGVSICRCTCHLHRQLSLVPL